STSITAHHPVSAVRTNSGSSRSGDRIDRVRRGLQNRGCPTGRLQRRPRVRLRARSDLTVVLQSFDQARAWHLDCHEHLSANEVYLGKTSPIAGVGHHSGPCRFGTDPKTSVLDVHYIGRTSSTTATSSTRASSRASGP